MWLRRAFSLLAVIAIALSSVPASANPGLALDGSNHGGCNNTTSCSLTLTTTNANDIIIVACSCTQWDLGTFSASGASLSWTLRKSLRYANNFNGAAVATWYAVASSTLSSASITVSTTGTGTYFSMIVFGVSGADTSVIFDSNAALPTTDIPTTANCPSSGGNPYPCSNGFSTSFAKTLIFQFAGDFGSGQTQTAGTGFTLIASESTASGNEAYSQYKTVSATVSNQQYAFGSTDSFAVGVIGDAIVDAGQTVTQPLKITKGATGAPATTWTISGCAVSPTTLADDGSSHNFVAQASCALTITAPALASGSRVVTSTGASSYTVTTCASGTCTVNSATDYYQVLVTVGNEQALTITPTQLGVSGTAFSSGSKYADYGASMTVAGTYSNTWASITTPTYVYDVAQAGIGIQLLSLNNALDLPILGLDGSNHAGCTSATSCSVTITTTKANDIIVIGCSCTQWDLGTFSVSGGSLSWIQRKSLRYDSNNNGAAVVTWYAVAPNALSSTSVTVSSTSAGTSFSLNIFAISGADTTTIFDSNVALPTSGASSTANCPSSGGNPYPCSNGFSTSASRVFVFQFAGDFGSGQTQTAGTGFNLIASESTSSGNEAYSQYVILTSPVTNTQYAFGSTDSFAVGVIGDAIIQNSQQGAGNIQWNPGTSLSYLTFNAATSSSQHVKGFVPPQSGLGFARVLDAGVVNTAATFSSNIIDETGSGIHEWDFIPSQSQEAVITEQGTGTAGAGGGGGGGPTQQIGGLCIPFVTCPAGNESIANTVIPQLVSYIGNPDLNTFGEITVIIVASSILIVATIDRYRGTKPAIPDSQRKQAKVSGLSDFSKVIGVGSQKTSQKTTIPATSSNLSSKIGVGGQNPSKKQPKVGTLGNLSTDLSGLGAKKKKGDYETP